jgi:alginate O-acetyltransferase complex protein AlgI
MLFNSFPFIVGFLPWALAGYWLLARAEGPRLWFLLAASVAFYGYWDWRFAPLLLASIIVNWAAVQAFFACRRAGILVLAVAANLLCLGVFKYLGFFAGIVTDVTGHPVAMARLALPLGISFFTFHHIIYLVDLLRGRAPQYGLRDYALYIALFPQILAGPLVRHNEIMGQFSLPPAREGWELRVVRGIVLFLIGLAKKIFLADALASHADPIFAKAGHAAVSIGEAWTAALSFPFQIYFDFSGYSDMAIGLALLFGYVLPVNFDAPYRATSLRDFWRRWHMTLSRFLRDYLYIPLGGNRHGLPRQLVALLATMALGGLWHGAGWTFVAWGTLHGTGLALGVLWRRRLPPLPTPVGWALLLMFLLVTWVLFRAPSLAAAGDIFAGMLGQGVPGRVEGLRTVAIAAAVAMLGPTSQHFVERLRPHLWIAPAAAAATVLALLKLGDGPAYEFIYFRF